MDIANSDEEFQNTIYEDDPKEEENELTYYARQAAFVKETKPDKEQARILSFVPTVFGRYIEKGPTVPAAEPARFPLASDNEDNELGFLRVIQIRKEAAEELQLKKERKGLFLKAMNKVIERSPSWITVNLFLVALGISVGLVSVFTDVCVHELQRAHLWISQVAAHWALRFILWEAFLFIFVFLSKAIADWQPLVIGSGIPQIKVLLSGKSIDGFLGAKVLLAKVFGLIFFNGSGMIAGKEGPFIHISTILAQQLITRIPFFFRINEAGNMRQIIWAAATSVGVAACFGAPIGGIMFSIEVTSSNYPTRAYWYGSLASFFAAIIFRMLANLYSGSTTLGTALRTTIYDADFPTNPGSWADLIGVAIVGVLCGTGGVLFVYSNAKIVLFRRYLNKKLQTPVSQQTLVYMVGAIFLTGIAKYLSLSSMSALNELITTQPMNHYWMSGYSIFGGLLLSLVSRFCLQVIAMSFPCALGVFTPTMTLGAIIGRFIGEAMALVFATGTILTPGAYALMGAAAMSGAITQAVSVSVLVIELTGQSQSFLLVFAATFIAYYISRILYVSVYDSAMILQDLGFLPDLGHGRCELRAKHFMARNPHSLQKWASLEDVLTVLRKHKKLHEKDHESYEIPITKMKLVEKLPRRPKETPEESQYVPLEKTEETPLMLEKYPPAEVPRPRSPPVKEERPLFCGSVLYKTLEKEAFAWEKRVQEVAHRSGQKFKDLSRVQVNMYNFLYPNIKVTDVVFAPDSPITIIHDAFILWRLSNAFVVSSGILYGMITRRWLTKALTYTPGVNFKLKSLKAKKRR